MQTIKVKNPILRGFNPDPNILRVKERYYICVSLLNGFQESEYMSRKFSQLVTYNGYFDHSSIFARKYKWKYMGATNQLC